MTMLVNLAVLALGMAEYARLPGTLTGTTDPPPGLDLYTEADFCLIILIVAGALRVRGNLLTSGRGLSNGSVHGDIVMITYKYTTVTTVYCTGCTFVVKY